jgi:ATP-dependent Clp protease ATP-binding subunit ClpA
LPEFSAYSKHVVEHALEYTPEGGDVGTEHLLLGILSESGSEAQRILNDQYHVTPEKVKRIIKGEK